ncbi:MAG TPA: type II toxin-antitoxin system HipA family toxin [Sphingomonas sp.]|jgi:serine/threonine-protein kinase HipA|uniref:type II toxin-antitoxin system HipA family toxin n=1 Tax=Sphingomonas sp. TaxID=28214 RepID=UPI002ED985E2
MAELIVLLEERIAGRLAFENNRLSFTYDEAWRTAPDAYPLSLSMPLVVSRHAHAAADAFIWNLLPDNERTLDRWARQFQVSARNPFALIGAVGEDCAGAVQFVRPERLDTVRARDRIDIRWLDDAEIGARLRSVATEAATGRTAGENGQFSLAGAQPKTALLLDGDRWGVPAGRTPTTHILKPPARDLPGHAENEHFCLNLARELGLRAARSTVRAFDGQPTIVVERYDRRHLGGSGPEHLVRVHQEDMCQALGVVPWKKYQSDGGPDPAGLLRLIQARVASPTTDGRPAERPAERDRWLFVDALILNWLIAGTDAHAKNYSLLIGSAGTVRLAPLYDIASAFGVPDLQRQRMKLAMKIEYYRLDQIRRRHWERWAGTAGVDPGAVIARIDTMARAMPDAVARVAARVRADGLDHPVIDMVERVLPERALAVIGD